MTTKTVKGLSIEDWLADTAPPPPVAEGELTIKIAAEAWKVSDPTAKNRLDELVEEGRATKEPRTSTGGISYVYIPVV